MVVFGSRLFDDSEWVLGGIEIEQVNGYKYLDLDVKGNLSWNKFKTRILEKARKNMTISWAMGYSQDI